MNYLKLACLSLFTFCSLMVLTAQNEPKPPVFNVSFSNNNPKTGDIIEVIFIANVPKGFHMYSTYNKCDIGPLKLEVLFKKEKSFQLVGVPYSIGDKKSVDEVFKCELGQFEKKAEIRQKIKILSNTVLISGTIEGQWCTETVCYNFGSLVPVSFASTLKATGTEKTNSKTKTGTKKQDSKKTKMLNCSITFLKP